MHDTASSDVSDRLGFLLRPSLFWSPERAVISAWTEHLPFAFWLVDVLKPRTIVELGTHTGVSYSAMCQAVLNLGLQTHCHAVDSWKGDEHAGFYPEEVYAELSEYNRQHYAAFSTLIRSTFDEALSLFEDGTVDLLHIDGLHTYDQVLHDFVTWLPKLSKNAVVMFHDTSVRERDFGVFRLWAEISPRYRNFEFLHGYGLGVLGVGDSYGAPLEDLFQAQEHAPARDLVRGLFASIGRGVKLSQENQDIRRGLDNGIGSKERRLLRRLKKHLSFGRA